MRLPMGCRDFPWFVLGLTGPTLDHNVESFPVPRAPVPGDYKVIQAMLNKQYQAKVLDCFLRGTLCNLDTSTPLGWGGPQPRLGRMGDGHPR